MLNLPNSITIFRIFLVPIIVVVLLTKIPNWEFIGLGIFLIGMISDALDGYFARKYNQKTSLGALLDPVADKLLISSVFISLVEMQIVPAWVVVIIVGREFFVLGLRLVALEKSVVISASSLGKFKTLTQTIAIILLIFQYKLDEFFLWIFGFRLELFSVLAQTMLWVVIVTSIFSMFDYFMKFYRVIKE
ncbi:MAG: CDP-diacylglycerol--glycerol-3-phosphate 3-phosphatidyltransferase [Thermoanaerobaculia bacterium]